MSGKGSVRISIPDIIEYQETRHSVLVLSFIPTTWWSSLAIIAKFYSQDDDNDGDEGRCGGRDCGLLLKTLAQVHNGRLVYVGEYDIIIRT